MTSADRCATGRSPFWARWSRWCAPKSPRAGNKAVADFLAYLETLVARRRAQPGDPAKDVLTRLNPGRGQWRAAHREGAAANCIFLLNAGHETTTNLIGNGLVTLTENPAEKERLIEHPEMIKTASRKCCVTKAPTSSETA